MADPAPAPVLPPLDSLRELFHYDPLTGQITYLQHRGPRRPGDPAGSSQGGYPCLFVAGRQWRAAPACWALYHGVDPCPKYVHPLNGDPMDLRLANLALFDHPFTRPNHLGYKRAKRPKWYGRDIRYSGNEGVWRVYHRSALRGEYGSRQEAIQAKRSILEKEKG